MSDMALQVPQARFRPLLIAFAVALLIPAVSILLHELGHFGTHAAFGYEVNRLSYASVSTGDTPAGVDGRMVDGLSFAAGTGVSLLLLGVGVLSIIAIGMNPLGLGLVVFECLRAAMGFAMGVANAGWTGALAGRFGELRYVVAALGGPTVLAGVIAWIGAILPFAALTFVWRRITPSARLSTVGIVLVGLIAGLALWLGVVGPRVLPA